MKYDVLQDIINKNKEHKKKSVWQRVVTCMAALVVFCTTYALILPAVTLEDNLTCGIEDEEHVHDDVICYIDNGADVETQSIWEASLPKQLTGNYKRDLLATAKSQMRYSESMRNLIIDEEASVLRGYSRYGAWAQDPYGDWNSYFLSFCMQYAGVYGEIIPQSADCAEWIELLKAQGSYAEAASHTPEAGDILFLDMNEDGVADRVALVAEIEGNRSIKVIEGDVGGANDKVTKTERIVAVDPSTISGGDAAKDVSSGDLSVVTVVEYHSQANYTAAKVQYVTYELNDVHVMGYGVLPEQPAIYTYSDDNVRVQVQLPTDSTVPQNAVLKVTPIVSEDTKYAGLVQQAEDVITGTIKNIAFYDISFFTEDEEYIPVDDRAQVSMSFAEPIVDASSKVKVLHYAEENEAPEVIDDVTVTEMSASTETTTQYLLGDSAIENTQMEIRVAFETDGFSYFAVVEVGTGENPNLPDLDINDLGNQYFMILAVNFKSTAITDPVALENNVFVETVPNTAKSGLTGRVVKDFDDANWNKNFGTFSDLVWYFEEAENEGQYYISRFDDNWNRAYLNIATTGLSLSETKQAIQIVAEDVTGNNNQFNKVVYLYVADPEQEGYELYINLNTNEPNMDDEDTSGYFTANSEENASRGSHLILAQFTAVNNVLKGLDPLEATGEVDDNGVRTYMFRDDLAGAALPDNAEGNQGLKVDGFPDDYDAAILLRKNTIANILNIREDYEELAEDDDERAYVDAIYPQVFGEDRDYNDGECGVVDWMQMQANEVTLTDEDRVNVTIQLFNYGSGVTNPTTGEVIYEDINDAPLATCIGINDLRGFNFYHKSQYNAYTAENVNSRKNPKIMGCDGSVLLIADSLVEGYPVVTGSTGGDGNVTVPNGLGSLGYLFGENPEYYEEYSGKMKDGAGLFQYDSNTGYYYYDAAKNSAYYDKDRGELVLYDNVIRPMYIHGTQPKADNGYTLNGKHVSYSVSNFLPFNDPTENVIFDPKSVDNANGYPTAYLNEQADVWFGMSMEYEFIMPENGMVMAPDGETKVPMKFAFTGDDDVLVYIDGKLIMDIGGVHGAQHGEINFATNTAQVYPVNAITPEDGTVTVQLSEELGYELAENTTHKLQFFYLERGGNVSYNRIEFNMAPIGEDSLIVGKEVEPLNDDNESVAELKDFTFRVVQADAAGNPTDASYFKENTTFDIWKNGLPTGEAGSVDANGYFSLKPGHAAYFESVLDTNVVANTNCTQYIVQEIISGDEEGQYTVTYNVHKTGEVPGDTYTAAYGVTSTITNNKTIHIYSASAIAAGGSAQVAFRNATTMSELRITKKLANGVLPTEKTFTVEVKLGDDRVATGSNGEQIITEPTMHLIPVGTPYTLTAVDGTATKQTVTTEGQITLVAGQTVTISGILPGTWYEVKEVLDGSEGYVPTYTGVITNSDASTTIPTYDADSAKGEINSGQIVAITITNADYDFAVTIPISKVVRYGNGTSDFEFEVVQGTFVEPTGGVAGTFTESSDSADVRGTTITVSPKLNEGPHPTANSNIIIAYDSINTASGNYYYRIAEKAGTGDYIYDTTFYIVKVEVLEDTAGKKSASVTKIWRNGETEVTNPGTNPLEFVNHRTTSIKVTKNVTTGNAIDTFTFTASVVDENGNSVALTADDITFTLQHGGEKIIAGIPVGAIVTVTETLTDKYRESYNVAARYEAEYGTLNGTVGFVNDSMAANASNGAYVGNLGNAPNNHTVIPIYYGQNANASMTLRYAQDDTRAFEYIVNNGIGILTENLTDTGNWGVFADKLVDSKLALQQGNNTIIIGNSTAYAPNLDYISLVFDTVEGNVATVNVLGGTEDDPTTVINFINTPYYELPQTGGSGTTSYILGGLLTTITALATLLLYNKKHRKKVNMPS